MCHSQETSWNQNLVRLWMYVEIRKTAIRGICGTQANTRTSTLRTRLARVSYSPALFTFHLVDLVAAFSGVQRWRTLSATFLELEENYPLAGPPTLLTSALCLSWVLWPELLPACRPIFCGFPCSVQLTTKPSFPTECHQWLLLGSRSTWLRK